MYVTVPLVQVCFTFNERARVYVRRSDWLFHSYRPITMPNAELASFNVKQICTKSTVLVVVVF